MPPDRIKNTAFKPPSRATGPGGGAGGASASGTGSKRSRSETTSRASKKSTTSKSKSHRRGAGVRDEEEEERDDEQDSDSAVPRAPHYNDPEESDAIFSDDSSPGDSDVPDALSVLAASKPNHKRPAGWGDADAGAATTARKRGRPPKTASEKRPKKKAGTRRTTLHDPEDDSDEDDDDADMIDAGDDDDDDDTNDEVEPAVASRAPKQTIPANLLRTLLHHHFRDKDLKVGAEASLLLGKYVDTFVREAIARAVYERAEAKKSGNNSGGETGRARGASGTEGQNFVQVEDLEKLAPQLLLDF